MTQADKRAENLLARLEQMSDEEAQRLLGSGDKKFEPQQEFMRRAIEMGERGRLAGEPPVGACIVRNGELLACLHNAVISELDVTAHAEIRVLREACRIVRTLDLSGCEIYSTVEPCAMCMSACYYAGISRVTFGARLTDMAAYTADELSVTPSELIKGQARTVKIVGDFMRDDCLELLERWAGQGEGS